MKILFVHNFYTQKGGEDFVFDQECRLMAETEEVESLVFHNKSGIVGALQFFLSIWNLSSAKRLKSKIQSFKPDIIHFHNIHFALGPLAIRIAKKANVPIVMTLHNYRLICPSGILLDNEGKIFNDSLKEPFPWQAVKKKVYRKSMLQTFWLALINYFHRKIGTWKLVDKYITLTDFAREIILRSSLNLPSERFTVKPNFVINHVDVPGPRNAHFLFVGRLTEEKGIRVLMNAFKNLDYELKIAGTGPLKQEIEQFCLQHQNITYLGMLNGEQIRSQLRSCTALIFPSIWYEGMPMTLLEAFANATPVISSNLGAMSTIVTDGFNGLHFEADNAETLIEKLSNWFLMPTAEKGKYSVHALETYFSKYTKGVNREKALDIYNAILKD